MPEYVSYHSGSHYGLLEPRARGREVYGDGWVFMLVSVSLIEGVCFNSLFIECLLGLRLYPVEGDGLWHKRKDAVLGY